MNNQYKSNNNIVYSCKYHIIWCPKYRRKYLKNKKGITNEKYTKPKRLYFILKQQWPMVKNPCMVRRQNKKANDSKPQNDPV